MNEIEYKQFKDFIHKTLYETLTLQDYENILRRLDIPIVLRNGNEWRCLSGCHNANSHDGGANLSFNTERRSFHCWSGCNCSYNLLMLTDVRFKLIGQPKSRFQCLKWICEQCGIPFSFKDDLTQSQSQIYNWKSLLLKYTRHKSEVELKEYDKSIMNQFPKTHHTDWLDYGISEETLDKYNIRWYDFRNQIVIPCYDKNGKLIGVRTRDMTDSPIKYMPLKMLDGTEYNFPTSQVMYGENFNDEAIQRKKTCWLVEAEKSVLKADTWFGEDNITLALYGHELQKTKLKHLLELGVETLVIMLDSDFTETCNIDIVNGRAVGENQEYVRFFNNVLKIYKSCKPYMKEIYVCYNNQGYNGYKYSPFDFTKKQFDVLFKNKELIEI